jgi:hypothetical protein
MARSAQNLTETATDLIAQIAEQAQTEARKYLADRLAKMARGTAAADKEIHDCEGPEDISLDFRAGLAFAAELIADPNFDF